MVSKAFTRKAESLALKLRSQEVFAVETLSHSVALADLALPAPTLSPSFALVLGHPCYR